MNTFEMALIKSLQGIEKQLTRIADSMPKPKNYLITRRRDVATEHILFERNGEIIGSMNCRRSPFGKFPVYISGDSRPACECETTDEAEAWLRSRTKL